ncbi:ecotropic viral integration site 5 ortholog [Epinephelus fuscoguttatus]|uniref:ecotropic viral integration site 5 ortholog n=1 Tax=Epinephelus fuscoguttatus TaxID=293821 RepID=UPI0020D0D283|nr:ecotropic viral integration site 5 ortholog [Epinephelus fuscoguttatus]XP_049441556.1 ecotropic viral integration site 5 ortholog [Epinephelus fuscoguttatus]
MSSQTGPAQKNLSEEDSSGSDVGSEVGLEPETDRFGFIVTNGSTAGSVGPPPELVRQRETKWINIISQWDRMLLKKTSKVKVQCQKGIPASLRAKCWPLLCGATDKMKQNENLYQSLDSQPALQSWVDVIERDLDRQFPFHEMFLSKDGHGQRGLFRVLKAYTQYQPEEGYCQAQGPVAAVLLMNMPAEEAFWCLVQISEQYLPGYYSPLLEGVLFDAAMLTWVLKRTCPAAHKHLQHHGVEPLMFATDWLMCLFTRHLPFNTLLRVWDLFFCYGVRVLLQVAVVLVRRVLGRAEQRKQCQGQMETLERLRGVREEVHEEDDTFIAEVCSVQLSARDLEKHTEKELEKWRKDRPSSTFDPRGRCQGYRMAWARARQSEEARDREAREKGNLSVPLTRSASTLSLSPSLLQKRWKKGGKASAREWEGGGKVVRHLSMGAKEDFRSWTELNFKKVQGVQEEEDVVFEEHKKQSEKKLTGEIDQKELLEEPKKMEIQNVPTEHVEETVIKDEIVQMETRTTEKGESPLKETVETKMLSEETEKTNVGTEQTNNPAEDQTSENILQPEHKQGEELDSSSPSQVLEQQSPESKHLETEVKDTNKETEEQSGHTAAVEENQTEIQEDADKSTEMEMQESVASSEEQDVKPEESTETENVQQTQVAAVTAETSPGSETDGKTEAATVKDPPVETETQQQDVITETEGKIEAPTITDPPVETETQQQDVITETDQSSQGDAFEGKYQSHESLAEIDMTEEPHTQSETESDALAQTQETVQNNAATQDELEAEIELIDSQHHTDSHTDAETLIRSSPECIEQQEDTDLIGDTEAEAETPASSDIVTESSEALEKECDAAACEPTQEEEGGSLTAPSEAQVDKQTEETTETETTDSIASPLKDVTSTQAEAVTLTTEPDGETSSVEMSISEEPAPEQPTSQVTVGAVEEEESTETVQENTVEEDDVFIPTAPTDSPNTDSIPQVQENNSPLVKDQEEPNDSSLTQASALCSSRSSGDVCIRKPSSSRGARLARRLSEDLFIMPERKSQSIPNHPEVEHGESQSNPGVVNPTQTPSDVSPSPSAAVTETTAAQQEQPLPDPRKRFGLFRRLRGEQPKKASKMQVPKILIQDFSDGTGMGKPVEEEAVEEKLSSRERRRRRRERERKEKEEEKLRKKKEKELEKERERERRKPQTRGKSFQVQREKGSSDEPKPAKTASQTLRYSASFTESYF